MEGCEDGNKTEKLCPPTEEYSLESNNNISKENGSVDYEVELVRAFSDFNATDENQLSFKSGDSLNVLQKTNDMWWWAELGGSHGYIPVTYVTKAELRERKEWHDEEYFDSYSTLKLHHEMLSDRPRMNAFYSAVKQNVDFIRDKIVLDVGCGTGILSLFCAKHGKARKVYAVERSQTAQIARKLVLHNGYSSAIRVIQDLVEDVSLPEKVDLIISEWMGTFLLFEMMIESIILARDRFLSDEGVVWPSHARLHLVPCSAHGIYENQINFWGEHFDIDFSILRDDALDEFLCKPLHNHVMSAEDALADYCTLFELDMKRVSVSDVENIESTLNFKVTKTGTLHGFCSWFGTDFGGDSSIQNVITLNTGPEYPLTHWKQNLFLLDDPVSVEVGDMITGTVTITRNQDYRRHLHVMFELSVLRGADVKQRISKLFVIWR